MPTARRRWRFYRTSTGRSPVRDFLDGLSDADAASVAAAMHEVAADGLLAARHLVGEIYEVRADGSRQTYRVLFTTEGRRGQVLLALEGFSKKTQRTPATQITLAQRRLTDWRGRGGISHA
jgi:phage-related protein